MMPDNRNFILAIALSLAVFVAWQFFYIAPQQERARELAESQQTAEDPLAVPRAEAPASGQTGAAGDGLAVPNADAALPTGNQATAAASPRVPIRTDAVSGSINLRGARLDDLHLERYREAVNDDSETIVFLKHSGVGPNITNAFMEFGWQPVGTAGAAPDGATLWTAPGDATLTPDTPVVLTWDNGEGLWFRRTIAVDDAYMFTVTDEVTNTSGEPVSLAPYGRFTRTGEPEVSGFWVLHEGPIGVFEGKLKEEGYKGVREDGRKAWDDVQDGWLGITDKYWAGALIPEKGVTYDARFVHSGADVPTYQADFRADPLTIGDDETIEFTTMAFAGAKVVQILDAYSEEHGIHLFDRMVTWGWFWFITKPLFYVIDFFFGLFGNFGVAILAVTVVVKALFFPLASKSYRSMSAMRKMQPKMTEIRDRYKDDKAKQQQELMELYKTEKINPLAGCWPVLLQIPVFFALYSVLFVTIEMRHAPFFGWIQDLAAPDPTTIFNLFGLIPWDPPSLLMLGIWPLFMGITMWVQMKLNPTPPDPTQAMVFNWMPVIFTFMLASFPAGLVIYWAWNNLLSVIQQYVIMRREGVDVDLLGNIMSTFRKTTSAATQAAATATGSGGTETKAEETAAEEPRQPKPVVQAEPVDPSRKVRPKSGAKKRSGRASKKPRPAG